MFNLSGRVAVVTGGSSGLGVQFAHALGRQGADVVVIARRVEMLKEVAASITEKYGVRTGYYYFAVNCAGGGNCGNTEDLPDEKWHKTMDVNINGVFYCCREFGKAMIKNGYGRMINISSMLGSVGMDFAFGMGIPEYAASKGAVCNLTRQLGAEWARYNITCNAIAPGFFASEVSPVGNEKFDNFLKSKCPMKRHGHPGELDSAVVFLAADESSYVTGQIIGVDGGWTCI